MRQLSLLLLLLATACASNSGALGLHGDGHLNALSDFALEDHNTTSITYATDVAFSDQHGAPAAWYFGHGT